MLKLDNHELSPIGPNFLSSFISAYKRFPSILDGDNDLSIFIINCKLAEKCKQNHKMTKRKIFFENLYINFFSSLEQILKVSECIDLIIIQPSLVNVTILHFWPIDFGLSCTSLLGQPHILSIFQGDNIQQKNSFYSSNENPG